MIDILADFSTYLQEKITLARLNYRMALEEYSSTISNRQNTKTPNMDFIASRNLLIIREKKLRKIKDISERFYYAHPEYRPHN